MSRFEVFRLPKPVPRYVVDVQSDFLSYLATRTVIPLARSGEFGSPLGTLNPAVEIGGETFVLATPLLAAMRVSDLKQPVASLAQHRDEIIRALDILFTGI